MATITKQGRYHINVLLKLSVTKLSILFVISRSLQDKSNTPGVMTVSHKEVKRLAKSPVNNIFHSTGLIGGIDDDDDDDDFDFDFASSLQCKCWITLLEIILWIVMEF